ncbi:xylulokinase [Geodermatophilus sp. SYSU D00697]
MSPRVVVGVDSSTQSCKAEVRDVETGALLGTGAAPHHPAFPPCSEQDPQDWWTAASTAIRSALASAGSRGGDVAALSVAGQCHGLVALDGADRVLRPAKLWNDTTSTPHLRRLRSVIDDGTWARRVGSVPTAAFTVGKLAWLAAEEPHHFAALRRVLLPHDYLTHRLTGRYVTDRSEASGTAYFDAVRGEYALEVLAAVAPRADWPDLLPEVLGPSQPAGTVLPEVAEQLGLAPTTLVGAGGGDQHAAALGLGMRSGDVLYVLGTSGVVAASSPRPVHDPSGLVDGVADMTGGWLPLVSTLNAARVTDAFARLLGVGHAELARLALAAPAATGPVLVAYLDGERKPDRPEAHGVLAGITSATTREDVARAAFEGVLLGLVDGQEHLRTCGVDVDGRVLAAGGGARSPAYTQLLADLTGRPVEVADEGDAGEATARGACVQAAAVATGTDVTEVRDAWRPDAQVRAVPRATTRDPRPLYAAVAASSAVLPPAAHTPLAAR